MTFGPKVVCLARTFRKHAAELGNLVPTEPIFFLKAPNAVIGPGEPIRLPPESECVQHEAEVAVVLGARLGREATPESAYAAISAWTVLNDVTARDLQREDQGRFGRAKGFDSFCPLSDVRLLQLDWRRARIQCLVNGEIRQDGVLADLVFTPGEALAYVARHMTLDPGDVVSLGTPEGVGLLQVGETVEVRLTLDGDVLASLVNPVTAVEGASPC